jgi:F0F1-type ATP synthase assembly protein I
MSKLEMDYSRLSIPMQLAASTLVGGVLGYKAGEYFGGALGGALGFMAGLIVGFFGYIVVIVKREQ